MTDLGAFGGRSAEPTDVNESGRVAAFTWDEPRGRGPHAYLWQDGRTVDLGEVDSTVPGPVLLNDRGEIVLNGRNGRAVLVSSGARTDLGALGPDGMTRAEAPNDRGEVVGWSRTAARRQHAFLWRDGKITDIGRWGWKTSWAVAINEKGHAIGWRLRGGRQHVLRPPLRAILWRDGAQTDLGGPTGKGADAVAINGRDVVVGSANTAGWNGSRHAFRWAGGKMVDLGVPAEMTWSAAVDVNERGQIVGFCANSRDGYGGGYRERALLWENGRVTELGVPKHQTQSRAVAINEHGRIALNSSRAFEVATERALVWENGRMTDFGPGTHAVAINDRGQVVGTRETRRGVHVVLWTLRAG